MKILLDMNLSPLWILVFEQHGWIAAHWSTIGNPAAPDAEIMQWAADNKWIVCQKPEIKISTTRE